MARLSGWDGIKEKGSLTVLILFFFVAGLEF
jgi:hypothetical protein